MTLAGVAWHKSRPYDLTKSGPERLTPKQIDLMAHIANGLSSKEVAIAMGITKQTVRGHLSAIFAKFDVANRMQAVNEAHRLGYLETGSAACPHCEKYRAALDKAALSLRATLRQEVGKHNGHNGHTVKGRRNDTSNTTTDSR